MNETVNQEATTTTAAGEQQEPRTFTQTEMNSIIADRLARERAKYADYDDLKAKAQQTDTVQAQLDALTTANAQRDMRSRVAAATGAPVELLTGDTEEACTAQAKAIKQFAEQDPGYPCVRDGGTAGSIGNIHPSADGGIASAFSRNKKHVPKPYPNY